MLRADANRTVVDFLDVTFNIRNKEYKPYSKPGNTHLYVHVESNHPPIIKKRIPQSIQTRLSNISSNEDVFKNAKPEYEKALQDAGHQTRMIYAPKCANTDMGQQQRDQQKEEQSQRQRGRRRNVMWFNPPYSQNVRMDIGRKFIQLINKHFPKENQLNKIFNRNTLKISYSCMDNMEKIIKAHNNSIINTDLGREPDACNCRRKEDCPLPGKCTTKNVVYEAKVATPNEQKTYIGLTSSSFKTRYTTHKASFNHREKSNQTELSKLIWKLKDDGVPYTLTWKIVRHAQPYSPRSKRCNLCLWEKYYILIADRRTNINSRTEIISTCRHKRKHLLSEYHNQPQLE